MKIIALILLLQLFIGCANSKDKTYVGSTPAGQVVRAFLGIPLADSVDFIRWKLNLSPNNYQLRCNYGIGKANTNGFIHDGKQLEISGYLKKEKFIYLLQYGNKTLKIAELNNDLLHFLNADNSLLVGNGGWSYTLSNISPTLTNLVNINSSPSFLKDSMSFTGRTPCNVPGIVPEEMKCYKLKWFIVLYSNVEKNESGSYKVYGTPWRKEAPKTGSWLMERRNGQLIYRLNDEQGNGFLYFLKPDANILMFIDANGKLLVGNEDFSYTLNRRY
jgi:hypothetical protein